MQADGRGLPDTREFCRYRQKKRALPRFLSYRRIRRHTVPPPKAAMEAREFIRVRFTKHDKTVIESYALAETDTELYITERVNNVVFEKE